MTGENWNREKEGDESDLLDEEVDSQAEPDEFNDITERSVNDRSRPESVESRESANFPLPDEVRPVINQSRQLFDSEQI